MFFKGAAISALALFCANGAMGAAAVKPPQILIATDAYFACNCPNNCDHHQGSSCKYYGGPSDNSNVIKGSCEFPNGNHLSSIECVED